MAFGGIIDDSADRLTNLQGSESTTGSRKIGPVLGWVRAIHLALAQGGFAVGEINCPRHSELVIG